MPYIVTTLPAEWRDYAKQYGTAEAVERSRDGLDPACRRAVAMLEEAREAAVEIVRASFDVSDPFGHGEPPLMDDAYAIPEAGGTVGPLPGGIVVEVESAEWATLALAAGLTYPAIIASYAAREPDGNSAKQIIAAYNAAQEIITP